MNEPEALEQELARLRQENERLRHEYDAVKASKSAAYKAYTTLHPIPDFTPAELAEIEEAVRNPIKTKSLEELVKEIEEEFQGQANGA